jgi:hypothetical protein
VAGTPITSSRSWLDKMRLPYPMPKFIKWIPKNAVQ